MLWFIRKDKEFESYSQPVFLSSFYPQSCDSSAKIKNLKVTHNRKVTIDAIYKLWFIRKDKEFESYSQQGNNHPFRNTCCDSSAKIKNLKKLFLQRGLWFIRKDKEFESYSQLYFHQFSPFLSCDSSAKIKNLKVTHNALSKWELKK